ncbi:MAG: GDP-mannose 4,6-dehydratase [Pseudolabrys sp.]|nr:GDP-mannose 4,6-dehydratase [Pseudolabrys sp.]
MSRTALILGVTGQDGAYLTRFLASKDYTIHGTSRDADMARLGGLTALGVRERVQLHSVSPTDFRSVLQAIERVEPDEIYNLSGQSSVALSFAQPRETMDSIVSGTLNILEALRVLGGNIRFYNAGSSEIFGDTGTRAADEGTAFRPKSPYGVAKAAAVSLVANYRESYALFACSGLLFNHESPLRPERFVTRKITAAAARIASGGSERLRLGNLALSRDFGWAPEYVVAMWTMLDQQTPDDFIIASGKAHTLEEFVAAAFGEVGLDWKQHVDFDTAFSRPSDIAHSLGEAGKAARLLGWKPSVKFTDIVKRMVRGEREGAAAIL